MTKLEELTKYIKKLPANTVNTLLDSVKNLLVSDNTAEIPDCPYCTSAETIRYGHKCHKQRFLYKQCGHTFVTTTYTVMSHSHSGDAVWREVISDTIQGHSIAYSAEKLEMNNAAVFRMRHKILLALQELPETKQILLSGVSEMDKTFVLESYKGAALPEGVEREARKRGISSEYVCICTGIERGGDAYAATVNRANRMGKNWQAYLQATLPREPCYYAMD